MAPFPLLPWRPRGPILFFVDKETKDANDRCLSVCRVCDVMGWPLSKCGSKQIVLKEIETKLLRQAGDMRVVGRHFGRLPLVWP